MNRLIKNADKIYTFNEIKQIETNSNYFCFDNDPKYQKSQFVLQNINLNKINIFLDENFKKDIDLSIEYGYNISYEEDIDIVLDLIEKINVGIELEAIVLNKQLDIIDGFHRCFAYLYLGIYNVKAFIEI